MKRKEALAAGLKTYFTGKPCRHGHIEERYVSSRTCVECQRLQSLKIEYKEFKKRWWRERINLNLNFKISRTLRSRLHRALKQNRKTGSTVRDLGCTISEFKLYIESKFLKDMSWENWGTLGWHLDHIKPLSSFDLSDREQFKKAVHFTNLQPLWATENLKKGSSVC